MKKTINVVCWSLFELFKEHCSPPQNLQIFESGFINLFLFCRSKEKLPQPLDIFSNSQIVRENKIIQHVKSKRNSTPTLNRGTNSTFSWSTAVHAIGWVMFCSWSFLPRKCGWNKLVFSNCVLKKLAKRKEKKKVPIERWQMWKKSNLVKRRRKMLWNEWNHRKYWNEIDKK